jgi:hypothetical protein
VKPKERNVLIRQWLRDYDAIRIPDHQTRDRIGWIALKLSCSRADAERYITDALDEDGQEEP